MKKTNSKLSIFCWNIANPSLERAKKQIEWLEEKEYDVIVLTEVKKSKGCLFIEKYFKDKNYGVAFRHPEGNKYGAMIISRHDLQQSSFDKPIKFLPSRVVLAKVFLKGKEFEIIATYIPSRDRSKKKIKRKKKFINRLEKSLDSYKNRSNIIFCGDFNVLEPDHDPHYSIFKRWEYNFYKRLKNYNFIDAFRSLKPSEKEYSWVGRTGNGYRYDHCFVSKNLLSRINKCYYLHQLRESNLSDHSAIITNIKI
jgi:exodeoxyribonuclease-3